MFQITLPVLGLRWVRRETIGSNHFLYQSFFGWHDCTSREDAEILRYLS